VSFIGNLYVIKEDVIYVASWRWTVAKFWLVFEALFCPLFAPDWPPSRCYFILNLSIIADEAITENILRNSWFCWWNYRCLYLALSLKTFIFTACFLYGYSSFYSTGSFPWNSKIALLSLFISINYFFASSFVWTLLLPFNWGLFGGALYYV
jgi:hypothetical protein